MLTRAAFTLFEVALSLVLVTFSIVSVLMLFPLGLKAQQLSRFQVLAATKALEMVDAYNSTPTANPSLEVEAPNPWDVSSGRSNSAFDLEHRLSSYRFGIMPVPTDIARRLDSDADEIQALLGQGAQLYYSQPQATTGFMETGLPDSPPNETQRLVFAVVGYAQTNAIAVFPWKAWPYYIPMPSPPCHGTHGEERGFSEPADSIETNGGKRGILWEDTFDRDMRPVFWCEVNGIKYGYRDHWATRNLDSAKRYCRAALWYCKKKGVTPALYDLNDPLQPRREFDRAMHQPQDFWKQAQALRFLSHAATCLTTYVTKAELDLPGVTIEAGFDADGSGTSSDEWIITTAKITTLHESAKNLLMLFAASYPYDWAVPRPLERTIMMDHPLIEWDLFSAPLTGSIWQGSGVTAEQWKPVSAQPISHLGRSFQFSNQDILGTSATAPASGTAMPNANWGDAAHFTLTRPFKPSERCRQLVFWAVDWMSYEDCETAPSAEIDANRYPRGAPRNNANFEAMMSNPPFFDWQQYIYRNPEKVLVFKSPVAGLSTGADVSSLILGSEGGPLSSGKDDQLGRNPNAKYIFSGLYGADRNFNKKLDRGPVPRSVRMRATEVARLAFYDLRVPAAIR